MDKQKKEKQVPNRAARRASEKGHRKEVREFKDNLKEAKKAMKQNFYKQLYERFMEVKASWEEKENDVANTDGVL